MDKDYQKSLAQFLIKHNINLSKDQVISATLEHVKSCHIPYVWWTNAYQPDEWFSIGTYSIQVVINDLDYYEITSIAGYDCSFSFNNLQPLLGLRAIMCSPNFL